jgi:hypothetical protein
MAMLFFGRLSSKTGLKRGLGVVVTYIPVSSRT